MSKTLLDTLSEELEKELKSYVKQYLTNSEDSLNTPNLSRFQEQSINKYTELLSNNSKISELSSSDKAILENTLKNYVSVTCIPLYQQSLVNKPRIVNNLEPFELTTEIKDATKEALSKIQDTLNQTYKTLAKQVQDTGNAPNVNQLNAYLKKQIDSLGINVEDPNAKQYIANNLNAYLEVYDNKYEDMLDKNDININNTMPDGTKDTSNNQTNKDTANTKNNEAFTKKSTTTAEYMNTYRSFSGCDMVATINYRTPSGIKMPSVVLGSLQTINYSIHKDQIPVRNIGNQNAKEYVFGNRTIAGSLVFAVFNKHWAIDLMENYTKISGIGTQHFLVDEIPPFDVTITFANEYGGTAFLALYGIRIVDEGMVMSINDIYTENTYQYVATNIDYLADVLQGQTSSTYSGTINKQIANNKNAVAISTASVSSPAQLTTNITNPNKNKQQAANVIDYSVISKEILSAETKEDAVQLLEQEKRNAYSILEQAKDAGKFATELDYARAKEQIKVIISSIRFEVEDKYDEQKK